MVVEGFSSFNESAGSYLQRGRSGDGPRFAVHYEFVNKQVTSSGSAWVDGDWRIELPGYLADAFYNSQELLGAVDKGELPGNWRDCFAQSEPAEFEIKGTNGSGIKLAILDLRRLAEIAGDGLARYSQPATKTGRPVTIEEFSALFRREYAWDLAEMSFFGAPSLPDDETFDKWMKLARDAYRLYEEMPVGSIVLTENIVYDAFLLKKGADGVELAKYDRRMQFREGIPSFSVAGNPVTFTGVDSDCAPHMYEQPVMRLDFGFPPRVAGNSRVVNEREAIEAIDSIIGGYGKIGHIWVQNPPEWISNAAKNEYDRGNWHPNLDQLLLNIDRTLGITRRTLVQVSANS